MPFKAQMAVLKRLEEIASVRYLTKEEQWEYDRTLKMYRDNKAAEAYTDEKVQEAKAAKAELRAAKAELKAAKAEKAKLKREVKQVKQQVTQDVARNLKKLGMDTDLIVQTTGLTRGEIDEL
jgi:phage terminase Nu1 subunit (DNA packaging protein)